jgi:hypothetical protein
VAGIQKKVIKRGKRSAVYRFILAKGDKEKIASWKQDLVRVLHDFNVRFFDLLGLSELRCPLSRLNWIDTRTVVTDTQAMIANARIVAAGTQTTVLHTHVLVADMHRKVLTGQDGASGQHPHTLQ